MGYAKTQTTKDYLTILDNRLGFSKGTLYNMCIAALKSKVEKESGVTVTFRGMVKRQKRLSSHMVNMEKAIFLIEFKIIKNGIECDKVVQLPLGLT